MKALPPDMDLATRKLLLQQRSAVLRELLAVQLSQTWQRMEPVVSKWMSAMQTPSQDGESSPAQPPAKEG
jgi:hypothetical protein